MTTGTSLVPKKYGRPRGPRRFFAAKVIVSKPRLIRLIKVGHTDKEISAILNVSEQTIRRRRKKHRIFRGSPLSKYTENKVLSLRMKGLTDREIARKLGMQLKYIRRAGGGMFFPERPRGRKRRNTR